MKNNTNQHGDHKEGSVKDCYICPMHPEVISEQPGLCPECGMNLVPTKVDEQAHRGPGEHDKHPSSHGASDGHSKGHTTNIFKVRFWVSLILSIPVLVYSGVIQDLLGFRAPVFLGSEYLPFVVASVIFFYGGWIFMTSAVRELRARLPGMMTLIALAIVTAYAYSTYVTFAGEGKTLYWELATLITVMLLGHWMEMRAVSGAQGALRELSQLLPDEAEVIRDGKTETIAIDRVKVGEILLVKPGGRVPTDGIVKEGTSDVDESIATGESNPVMKKSGSEVIAGTTNGDGSLHIEVTKIGKDTFLAGVMRLVAEAQASKSRLQLISDRAAYYLTLIAVVTGSATLVWWLSVADAAFAFERMVTVLVIACPHALGLAIPLVASISTSKAARSGFLVKQRLALEAARNIDVVLFDKTGTLTSGTFGIDQVVGSEEADEVRVLQLSASLNSHSEHPIGRVTVAEAKRRSIPLLKVVDFKRIPGMGVRASIEDHQVLVGSRVLVDHHHAELPKSIEEVSMKFELQGKTVNYIVVNGRVVGAIALADVIREESRTAIRALHDMGMKTAMVTGDAEEVAKRVAAELGIHEYFSRVLPEQKAEKVKLLQARGQKVAMVGDGINDAPALAQADLGIAIGAGTNVALESAGIILVKDDPQDIAKVIRLSQLTYTKMIQNLFWAAGYNVVAIPLAAGVLASRGILLQPAVGALLMSVSTVIVAVNAMLLRKADLS